MKFILLDLGMESSCKQWDEFVQSFSSRGHHHHTCYLRAILDVYSHNHLSLMAMQHDKVIGVLPLIGIKSALFGKQLVSMPYYNYGGALAIGEDVELALYKKAQSLADTHGYDKLQIRGDKALPSPLSAQGWHSSTHKANMLLPLPESMQSVGAGNAKKRAKLRSQSGLAERRAQELNIELKQLFGQDELLNDFYRVFSQHMRDLGTPVFGKSFFQSMLKHTHSEITVTYWGGEPVGCGWLFHHSDQRTSIPWASTLKKMHAVSLNSYMYYNILSRSVEQGARLQKTVTFDFGRSSIDAGTYHFKAQWGAEPQQCHWYEWDRNGAPPSSAAPADGKFGLMVRAWQKMPLWCANALGPHLIKSIPA